MKFLKKLWKIIVNFYKKGLFTISAALSYYAMLAIFPFFIMLVYFSTVFFKKNLSVEKLDSILKLFPPSISQTIVTNIDKIILSGKVFSAISAVFIVYFSFRVFAVLERALSIIYNTKVERGFWIATLKSFVLFVLTAFGLLFLFLISSVIFVIKSKFETITIINSYYILLFLQVIIETLFFALSYKYMSHKKLKWKNVLVGGFVAAFLWEILKHIFGLYIASIKLYFLLYGSIGSIVLLMLWLYYSFLVYLLGAEISEDL
ncbi:conserved hypothetical protein [Thermotomaculum hydrothermale]|uniref:Uncharacterized protein n=1 Tax=Thermotomaculum hydrothermale TaxID=981385 RepID=A0A7R6SYZ2_9BACT|nr:YihY/virulence factor BrkB family protein [Thermotomaculum hydrothermale]BBB33190.1 conserved hypothetical protein [Thermotomaculum hydrothermale]